MRYELVWLFILNTLESFYREKYGHNVEILGVLNIFFV